MGKFFVINSVVFVPTIGWAMFAGAVDDKVQFSGNWVIDMSEAAYFLSISFVPGRITL